MLEFDSLDLATILVKAHIGQLWTSGGRDSTPVRGVPYEPAVLLGVSEEPRLSRWRCFDELLWLWSRDGSPLDSEGSNTCRSTGSYEISWYPRHILEVLLSGGSSFWVV